MGVLSDHVLCSLSGDFACIALATHRRSSLTLRIYLLQSGDSQVRIYIGASFARSFIGDSLMAIASTPKYARISRARVINTTDETSLLSPGDIVGSRSFGADDLI